ncbi:hypothetical protein PSJ8397_00777 [Pseudooctadecabacter jejudonensis]|uniref:Uncharacterized protein n=1 Tax=Pseudooctadecabacter jejudonensis TaxID=1391910 RepID=A0A1Y5RM28_9RHOB|nr:hypothetical protein PSJ8397_00777 [Pseudooctadecabacter jejudonensis]
MRDIKSRDKPLNISRDERRVLHVLAQGGSIHFERMTNGKVRSVASFAGDGQVLADCLLKLTERLKTRRFITSENGRPDRATNLGSWSVIPQYDTRKGHQENDKPNYQTHIN